jgi:hypothetical protein
MLEGARLRATVALYRDVETDQSIRDYAPVYGDDTDPRGFKTIPVPNPASVVKTYSLDAGSRIVVNLITANHDPTAFPDPERVKLDRPLDSYIHFGWGPHQCLGKGISRTGLTAMFKQLVGLKGLHRAPGPRGQIKSMPAHMWKGQVGRKGTGLAGEREDEWNGLRVYMTADQSSYWPMPTTMKVRWTDWPEELVDL